MPTEITELEKAYSAGLFDGEGSVTYFVTKKGWASTTLYVANSVPAPILWLRDKFGGFVQALSPAKKHHLNCFRWTLSGEASEEFAKAILPYTKVKTDQLRLYLEARACESFQGRVLPPEVRESRLDYERAIKALKHVNHSPEVVA